MYVYDLFLNSYNGSKDKGITIINLGNEWIKSNYDGIKDRLKEYYDILKDLKNFNSFGKANILSKLCEIKFLKLDIYDDENSYQRKIIDDSYKIDLNEFYFFKGYYSHFRQSSNYFYYYIKYGLEEINNLYYSETESSIIIYSEKISEYILHQCFTGKLKLLESNNYRFQ